MLCPVCKETLLKNAVKIHIITKAKAEVWHNFLDKKTETPHANFYKDHTRIITKTVFTLPEDKEA